MRRYGEQVGLQRAVSELLEDEREVRLRRRVRDEDHKTKKVDGPEIFLAQSLYDSKRSQTLSIVHVTLGRIVAKNAVDEDFSSPSLNQPFLPLNSPFVLVGLGASM